MFAASGYETLKLMKTPAFADENWLEFWIGFVVSAVVAFIAVKWLLRYVQSHRFTVFAWYRIVFGIGLLLFLPG
jgi:undecaprenyl-diphosphatase